MKLLERTGFYFMGFSLLTLVIGCIGIFYGLALMFDHETDESLQLTRVVLYKELSKMDSFPPVIEIMDEVIDIKEIARISAQEIFKDTLRLIEEDGEIELEPYRQYIYDESINGKHYRIALNHSKFEKEHLQIAIFVLLIGFLFVLFLALNLFNRFLSQRLWQPFYYTIRQVQNFSFSNPDKLSTLPSDIAEFNTLDRALAQMTEKLSKDYHSLKHFAENASHEIQTPLAIIQSQIELLLQNQQDKNNLYHLQQIQKSTSKLSKLNKSLLLLTRIENRQFEVLEDIDLGELVNQKLEALEPLISAKAITIQKNISSVSVKANSILADIIISNLLVNAIRHNLAGGKISIQLNAEKLVLGNSGKPISKDPEELFRRFSKSDEAGQSLGLGLAIVKEICHLYQWTIEYSNDDQWHEIEIHFNN